MAGEQKGMPVETVNTDGTFKNAELSRGAATRPQFQRDLGLKEGFVVNCIERARSEFKHQGKGAGGEEKIQAGREPPDTE